ncbi:helix-turn-helix domain-containing protein [Amycolatopsis sp. VC5-11]|uniref:helix-turn-helix domain-containing protein n=1 Tax=Amycolatopsis sp. VC5-11 TaxID=3120156 RepID=UPI0030091BA7
MTSGERDHDEQIARIERNRQMLAMWRAGASITEIANMYGLSLSWTGRLLRQEGAVLPEIRQGVRRALDVPRIVREYESGATIQSIADAHQASYGTIRRLLLREKVRIRPHGGQNAVNRRKPSPADRSSRIR